MGWSGQQQRLLRRSLINLVCLAVSLLQFVSRSKGDVTAMVVTVVRYHDTGFLGCPTPQFVFLCREEKSDVSMTDEGAEDNAFTPRESMKIAEDRLSLAESRALEAVRQRSYRQALTVVMSAYGDQIHQYLRNMGLDPAAADDVLQTTFFEAYQSFERFSFRSSLRAWLFGIARHRSIDALRKHRRDLARRGGEATPSLENPGPSPERELHRDELSTMLQRCLSKLTPKARSAVLLRYREGLSFGEMAVISGERAPTLQARVARALPLLKRCVQAQGGEL